MPKARPFLAEFELLVMLALVRLGPGAYGAAILREIEDRTGRPVSMGAVYATLGRLEDKGFLKSQVSEPEPVRGGRSKKYYHLSEAGRRVLRQSASVLTRMLDGVDLIGQTRGGGGTR